MAARTGHPEIRGQDLAIRSRTNWCAVSFFGGLSVLHLALAWPVGLLEHYEGSISLLLGAVFGAIAVACWLSTRELTLVRDQRFIRVRRGCRLLQSERRIPFDQVRAVRLVLADGDRDRAGRLQLLCDAEEIDCPLTALPRQEALCLAVVLNVRLIRIHGDGAFLNDRKRQGLA